jgi:hypothetical protein
LPREICTPIQFANARQIRRQRCWQYAFSTRSLAINWRS